MTTKTKTEDKILWVPERIAVSELRAGNRLVTKTAPFRVDSLTDEQRESVLLYFFTEGEPVQVVKSRKVETIDECKSQWRTHVHVNTSMCFDTRQHVWIAVPL